MIDRMQKRYPDIAIGYSGHEAPEDNMVAMLAIAKVQNCLNAMWDFRLKP